LASTLDLCILNSPICIWSASKEYLDALLYEHFCLVLTSISLIQHGSFDGLSCPEASAPSKPGSCIGAAVAASCTVPSGSTGSVTFSLSWDCPQVTFSKGRTYYRSVLKFFGAFFNVHCRIFAFTLLLFVITSGAIQSSMVLLGMQQQILYEML